LAGCLNKEDQILDIRFEEFVGDQMACIKKIYQFFDWDLSALAEKNMKAFLAQNPKGKHGVHDYSLEQFGLEEGQIEKLFARYIEFLNKKVLA
jgi:hypothetical protein